MVTAVVTLLVVLLGWMLGLLPQSPFRSFIETTLGGEEVQRAIGYLNWFIPIRGIVALFGLWLAAAATYFLIRIVSRLITQKVLGLGGTLAAT